MYRSNLVANYDAASFERKHKHTQAKYARKQVINFNGKNVNKVYVASRKQPMKFPIPGFESPNSGSVSYVQRLSHRSHLGNIFMRKNT